MVNPYDLARNLGKALQESSQYQNYKAAKEAVDAKPELAAALNDFQEKQYALQAQQMMNGGNAPEDQMKQVQELFAILTKDPLAASYLGAEFAFTQMVSEIYGIIGEAVMPAKK